MAMNGEAEIAEVRARIEAWRGTGSTRGVAMPDELWAEAVALSERHGVYPISRQLRLSYDRLKLRTVEAELERVRQLASNDEPEVVGFVELPAVAMYGECGNASAHVTELELARADGARMRVRLAAEQQLDLVGLSESFFGAGR